MRFRNHTEVLFGHVIADHQVLHFDSREIETLERATKILETARDLVDEIDLELAIDLGLAESILLDLTGALD